MPRHTQLKINLLPTITATSLLALSLSYSSSSAAQQNPPVEIEEIIVSIDYRQANINEIPTSISILDSLLIEQKNAQHLEDILLNAPNVNFSSGASRARFYQIRGIGERGQFSEPLNSSVGVIIDGVDFSGIGNAAMLFDIEQVEVLMGPQGTRYGSNALAGLINLQSKAPTQTFSYGLQLEAGNYASNGIAGYLSGPISNNLLYRISLQKITSDGSNDNLTLAKPTNKHDETTLRGKLHWTFNNDISLDFNAALIDLDNGYDAFSLDNIRDTLSDQPGFDKQQSTLLSSTLRSTSFNNFSLEAIVGFAQSEIDYAYDEDWVYTGFHPYEYSSFDQYNRDRDTLSGEIRLISNDNGSLFADSTTWVAGIYALQQNVDLTRTYTYLASDFSSAFDIDRLALYAETSTTLTDRWSVDVGLRAERFSSSYKDSSGLEFSPSENLFGFKLAINYALSNNNLLYASASRGYKSGGFNIDGSLDADLREFDSEKLWNYEVGFKGFALNDTLQTQLALFYMDRDDVQIASSTVRLRTNGSSEFIDFVGNAAAGANYGLELNSRWQKNQAVALYASLGLLETEYQDFTNSAGDNLNGREQAHAPGYQYTLGTDITINPQLAFNINIQAKDKFYFSDSHSVQSESYTLVNANLSYTLNQWRFSLWGRNLIDEDYYVRGFFFGNDPRDDYTGKGYTQLGEPRRFGVTVNFDY